MWSLKKMIYFLKWIVFYPVTTNLMDWEKGTIGESGLFIPEQWCLPPYIGDAGNSQVEEALAALTDLYTKWKKELDPVTYQLRVSQHPRNIDEAFAYREASMFPVHLLNAQLHRIEDKEYPLEYVDLERNTEGQVEIKPSRRVPITDFPVKKNMENKEGVVVIAERPIKGYSMGNLLWFYRSRGWR